MWRTVVQAAMVSGGAVSLVSHERHQERCPELHLAAPVPPRAFREAGQRARPGRAHSSRERLVEPEWQRRNGERYADRPVTAREKAQSSAVRTLSIWRPYTGQPLERGPVPLGLGPLEDDLVVLGMASGHLVELPAVGELLERVDPRGLERTVLRRRHPRSRRRSATSPPGSSRCLSPPARRGRRR